MTSAIVEVCSALVVSVTERNAIVTIIRVSNPCHRAIGIAEQFGQWPQRPGLTELARHPDLHRPFITELRYTAMLWSQTQVAACYHALLLTKGADAISATLLCNGLDGRLCPRIGRWELPCVCCSARRTRHCASAKQLLTGHTTVT